MAPFSRSAEKITVILHDGSVRQVERVVVDDRLDLAAFRIKEHTSQALRPSGLSPGAGQPVVAVGAPIAGAARISRPGVVTSKCQSLQNELDPTRQRDYSQLIQSTAAVSPGFSGGPLLDADGRFVGINVATTGRDRDHSKRGYAIPFTSSVQARIARLAQQVLAD